MFVDANFTAVLVRPFQDEQFLRLVAAPSIVMVDVLLLPLPSVFLVSVPICSYCW